MPKFRFKLKIRKSMEFQYAHSHVSILKRKLRDWRYPNYTEKKVFLMTQPVSIYAGNTIQTLINTP